MSVQKYVVSQDETGFTILKNTILQNFNDAEALGVWVYLASLPPSWVFYKEQLRSHFNMGRDRLNRVLSKLSTVGLIKVTNARDEKGLFIHMHLHVCSMKNFNPSAQMEEPAPVKASEPPVQPLTENPLTANQLLDNDIYKDISKKKDNINNISNNYSATDVARKQNDDAFDEFWKNYPIKKNKVRSKKIWDREKFASIVTLICCDVLTRSKHEPQWQDKQFIPHPATYLGNKLWNDEVSEASTPKKSSGGKSSSFDQYQADLQKQTRGTTYEHGAISQ